MNDDVISYIINELNALHIYPINDKQYAIALKEITPQVIHCLHTCGCYNIQIAGIWKEWATHNVCMEYIEISCEWTKGE